MWSRIIVGGGTILNIRVSEVSCIHIRNMYIYTRIKAVLYSPRTGGRREDKEDSGHGSQLSKGFSIPIQMLVGLSK